MTKAVNVIGLTDLVTQFQYLTFALGEIQAYPILLYLVLHRYYVFYKPKARLFIGKRLWLTLLEYLL